MSSNVVYIDTETTGLDSAENEILEIAIVDERGDILLDSLVRPVRTTTWEQAERIHGISPQDVAKVPTLEELGDAIWRAVYDRDVVMYNAKFDSAFLGDLLKDAKSVQCCMEAFARFYGMWNTRRNCYKWQKLAIASDYVGHMQLGVAHRALADAFACRSVWRYVQCIENMRKKAEEIEEVMAIAA